MSVDIKFIARIANVSPATVSRVMNGSKPVSPELKDKILQIVQKYNYRPNSMARAMVLKKSNLIGVMTPNVSSNFHAVITAAIERVAEQNGYSVVISNISDDFQKQLKSLQSLSEHQIDGLILLHENTENEIKEFVKNTWIPIVTASVTIPHCFLPSVGIDEEKASYDATKYLISLGHKNIGGIFGKCYSLGEVRKKGFVKALNESGLTINSNFVTYADCTIESGRNACQQLFERGNFPSALFCISDEIAIGCIDYLKNHHILVPQDVSIIGFDDIQLASVFTPSLTTVHQPIDEIGSAAAKLLIDIIEKRVVKEKNILFPSNLVVRESATTVK
ncbi:MAG: LacI family DNA-binding transcriptional regulator [Clostridia bacterium]